MILGWGLREPIEWVGPSKGPKEKWEINGKPATESLPDENHHNLFLFSNLYRDYQKFIEAI